MSLYDYNLSLSHLGIFFSFVFRISGRLVPVKTNIYRFLRVTYTLISYTPLSLMFPTHLLATVVFCPIRAKIMIFRFLICQNTWMNVWRKEERKKQTPLRNWEKPKWGGEREGEGWNRQVKGTPESGSGGPWNPCAPQSYQIEFPMTHQVK